MLAGDFMANEQVVWDFFKSKGFTDAGAAGVLGNIANESAFNPKNLQNSYQDKLGFTDDSYTAAVDAGTYTESQFANDSAGYGLVQWTSAGRKQGLYNFWQANKEKYDSIGNLQLQLDYIWAELVNYSGLVNTLTSTDNICTGTSAFMLTYERPYDQSTQAQQTRCNSAIKYYNQFAEGSGGGGGGGGGEGPDVPPNPPTPATSGTGFYINVTNSEGQRATYFGTQLGQWIYFNDLRHYRVTNTGDRFQIFMRNNDWKEYNGFETGTLELISVRPYITFVNGVPTAIVEYYPFLY